MKDISVVKELQDNALKVIFRDSSDVYYVTAKRPHLELLVNHTLTLEQSSLQTRIRDSFGSKFMTMEWYEIINLKWKGQPLFTHMIPSRTIKTKDPRSQMEAKVPTFVYPKLSVSRETMVF